MNGARVFEDAYSGVFREQEDFFSCLHEIMGKSLWIRQKVRNLRLVPIIAGSTFEKELRSQYTEDGMDDGIISDTIANTALMLKYRGDMLPVRDCAIKSILDRAGIQGSGLRRVERNVYARILNDVLKVTKGEALLRISEGKVSAVLSGDCNDYAILNMEEIFLHTIPKKYQAEALDLFKAQYDVWSCTAHDIYFAISEILFMLECEGASGSRIAKMEEQIARALSMNWAEYDFPEM